MFQIKKKKYINNHVWIIVHYWPASSHTRSLKYCVVTETIYLQLCVSNLFFKTESKTNAEGCFLFVSYDYCELVPF